MESGGRERFTVAAMSRDRPEGRNERVTSAEARSSGLKRTTSVVKKEPKRPALRVTVGRSRVGGSDGRGREGRLRLDDEGPARQPALGRIVPVLDAQGPRSRRGPAREERQGLVALDGPADHLAKDRPRQNRAVEKAHGGPVGARELGGQAGEPRALERERDGEGGDSSDEGRDRRAAGRWPRGVDPDAATRSHGPVKGDAETNAAPTSTRGVVVPARLFVTGTPVRRRKSAERTGSGKGATCRERRSDAAAAGAAADVPENVVRRPPPAVGATQRTPGARIDSAGPPLLMQGMTSGPVTGSLHSASPSQECRSLSGGIDHPDADDVGVAGGPGEAGDLARVAGRGHDGETLGAGAGEEPGGDGVLRVAEARSNAVVGQAEVQDVDSELFAALERPVDGREDVRGERRPGSRPGRRRP